MKLEKGSKYICLRHLTTYGFFEGSIYTATDDYVLNNVFNQRVNVADFGDFFIPYFHILKDKWYKCVVSYTDSNSGIFFEKDKIYMSCSDGCLFSPTRRANIEEHNILHYFRPATSKDMINGIEVKKGSWLVSLSEIRNEKGIVFKKGKAYPCTEDNCIRNEYGGLFINGHDGLVTDFLRPAMIEEKPQTNYDLLDNFVNEKAVDCKIIGRRAVLFSQHQEVARIDVEDLGELWCMDSNLDAEDLMKVICIDGTVYWCDCIEFIDKA